MFSFPGLSAISMVLVTAILSSTLTVLALHGITPMADVRPAATEVQPPARTGQHERDEVARLAGLSDAQLVELLKDMPSPAVPSCLSKGSLPH